MKVAIRYRQATVTVVDAEIAIPDSVGVDSEAIEDYLKKMVEEKDIPGATTAEEVRDVEYGDVLCAELCGIVERPGDLKVFIDNSWIRCAGTQYMICCDIREELAKCGVIEEGSSCYTIGEMLDTLLCEHSEYSDHEYSCNYWYFKNQESAKSFVLAANDTLNAKWKRSQDEQS